MINLVWRVYSTYLEIWFIGGADVARILVLFFFSLLLDMKLLEILCIWYRIILMTIFVFAFLKKETLILQGKIWHQVLSTDLSMLVLAMINSLWKMVKNGFTKTKNMA